MSKYINGPYAVLMTPFEGNIVNEKNYIKQVKLLSTSELLGLVINGTTGEFIHLSLKEQINLAHICAQNTDKTLVLSAGASTLADSLMLCRTAKDISAKAVLVCPPYYFKYNEAESIKFYLDLADKSPIPIILYNVPFFTQEVEFNAVIRLSHHPNVKGIKDSSANMKRLMHFVDVAQASDFSVLTGTDDILFPALMGGCDGSMTAFASIFPKEICDIYKYIEIGNIDKAKNIQTKLMPHLRKADSLTFPKGYKRLMEQESNIKFKDKV